MSHTIGSHEVLPSVSRYWFPSGMAQCISLLFRQWYSPEAYKIGSHVAQCVSLLDPHWYGQMTNQAVRQRGIKSTDFRVSNSLSIGSPVVWPSVSLFWFPSGTAQCLSLFVPKWYDPVSHPIDSVSYSWFSSGMTQFLFPVHHRETHSICQRLWLPWIAPTPNRRTESWAHFAIENGCRVLF